MEHNPFSLAGTVTLVTGGRQGIGKVVAQQLAASGSDVVIVDIADGAQVAAEIAERTGVRTLSLQCDVTQPAEVERTMATAVSEFGKIDSLFNNAGIVVHKPALDVEPEEFTRVIDVDLNGVFFMAQAFARQLVQNRRQGSIVNTASMSGSIVNIPQAQASYNAAKAAVIHLTKSLAVEWAEHGIRVNCISPGYIMTEMTGTVREDWRKTWTDMIPFKRLGTPEELAGGVIYLMSNAASYTTGADLVIDGGFTLP
ncbi:MAG: SDR family oxidoreductase [Propioniciclava sp.]